MIQLSKNPTATLTDADNLNKTQGQRIATVLAKNIPGYNQYENTEDRHLKVLTIDKGGDVAWEDSSEEAALEALALAQAAKESADGAIVDANNAIDAANDAIGTANAASDVATTAAQTVIDKPSNTAIAPLFDTTKAYKIGDKVMYNGELYVFASDTAAGAWSTSGRNKTSALKQSIMSCQYINNAEKARSVFGDTPLLSAAAWNTIYNLSTGSLEVIGDAPVSTGNAVLITYAGNTFGQGGTQIFNTNNRMWYRMCWSGSYSAWHELNSDIDVDKLPRTIKRIGNATEAAEEFNSDINNAAANTIYAIAYVSDVANIPNTEVGTLLTYTGNTDSTASAVQIYVGSGGRFYARTKWSSTWKAWKEMVTSHNIQVLRCADATQAANIFGDELDLNDAVKNSIVTVSYTAGLQNLPFSGAYGILETYTGYTGGNSIVQYFSIASDGANENRIYNRTKWSTGWTNWTLLNKREETKYGYISDSTSANAYLNNTTSVSNAPENSVLVLNWSVGLTDLPADTGYNKQGFLITRSRVGTGASRIQFYVQRSNNSLYIRTMWSSSWTDWKLVNGGTTYVPPTEYIATFDKIGACGGSFATGYSVYVDSSDERHGINMASNSWIQLWGRKHGITAKNFSSAGWSIKDWFASAANIAAVEANPCKVYFTLFGGGNDIEDYDGMTNLGTIADVHVGSEDQNPQTFYGDYSRLIAKLQTVGGQHTKVISFTYGQVFNATKSETQLAYIKAINDIAALYNYVYVIPTMDDEVLGAIKTSPYYFGGHYSAVGYKKIADRLEELVDAYVDAHQDDFADVQWIGTNYDIAQWY